MSSISSYQAAQASIRRASIAMNLDGTSESPRGSQRGSQSGSRPGSVAGGSPRKGSGSAQPGPHGPSEGRDPARDNKPKLTPAEILGKRVDLPLEAYQDSKQAAKFTARPGTNTDGKQISLQLNIFNVKRLPRRDIYQYDITVSPMPEKTEQLKGLMKRLWNSDEVKKALAKVGGKWLCDYSQLVWSSVKLQRGEERITIPDPRQSNQSHYIIIKYTKAVRLEYLTSYLRRQASWDSAILECMSFLDHVMRQKASEDLISIKRNSYSPTANRVSLDTYLEVIKGTYAAFRLSDSILRGGTGMSVNIDISNTTFWVPNRLTEVALRSCHSFKQEWKTWDLNRLANECKPIQITGSDGRTQIVMSEAFKLLRRLHRLKFKVMHRGKEPQPKVYTVERLVWNDAKYGMSGAHSKNVSFPKNGVETTVFQHFLDAYSVRLQYPFLPLVETTKGAFYPLEVCNIIDHQRYVYKLDPQQTAAMIKIAVTRPEKRKTDIMNGVKSLDWQGDPYLKEFDLEIQTEMVTTNARLLQNPEITYANKKENPGLSGRWDLRGKKFWVGNPKPLKSWGMVLVGDACQKQHLEAFSRSFCEIYRGHGGKIDKQPVLLEAGYQLGDYGKITEFAYNTIGRTNKDHPTIIFFVLANKNQIVYERIKKNMDCRWCVVSQCLQGMHVKKNQAQYCSNVAMKVNAKLGGTTCKIAAPGPPGGDAPAFFKVPTMIIGLDVSHAAPGSKQPSMAAMTVSMDKHAARYAGSCETNGYGVEIVDGMTMHTLFPKLLAYWSKINGTTPRHVYYFRDGVSDGQFQKVIDQELKELRRIFREKNFPEPKFTVIVATKRHHIRFFPRPGDRSASDRNSNPLPGTLVEHDATHPFHFDFYLCSHVAIQGTARPVHYNVIYDEAGVNANSLQKMIYQQCYQYCRSTTPVSLHPAVYYSHLASQRARAHEDIASSQKEMSFVGKKGFPLGKANSEIYSAERPSRSAPLLAMTNAAAWHENIQHINTTMWYV